MCKSVQATVPALHVVIHAQTPTTDADVHGCPCCVRQTHAVDIVEDEWDAVTCICGDERLTRLRDDFTVSKLAI